MKEIKKLLKVIPLVFFIFIGNFYYEAEAKVRSSTRSGSRSSSRSSSSSKSSSSKSSSSSSKSSSSKSSSSSSKSSSSNSSSSSSKSSSSKSSSSSSKSSSSKSSSSSSKSSSSKSISSSSSSDNNSSSSRSNLDTSKDKNYAPKETKDIKSQTVNGKKIKANDIEDTFESKGINTKTTRKYYYPSSSRGSILDNPFVRYYLVYNLIDDTVEMVTDRSGYSDEQIVGVVSNENGEDEIIMFEEETKKDRWYSRFFDFETITLILVIIIIWIYISYRKTFKK